MDNLFKTECETWYLHMKVFRIYIFPTAKAGRKRSARPAKKYVNALYYPSKGKAQIRNREKDKPAGNPSLWDQEL